MVNLNGISRRRYEFNTFILCFFLFLLPVGIAFPGASAESGILCDQAQGNPSSSADTLFNAVKDGDINMVRDLIARRTDLNVRDSKGWTPLDYAKKRNKPVIRELLEQNGAITYPKSIQSMNEGPHVRILDDNEVEVIFLNHDALSGKSELKRENYQIGDMPLLIEQIEIGREDLYPDPEMAIQVPSYRGVREVFVIGDIHGEYSRVVNLLKNNGIIDDNNDWIWGKGHLVFMGDIFDRGRGVTEALWMVFNLEKQAEAAGGKVHLLLGNHEPMIFKDDLRYVADEYYSLCENLGLNYSDLFSYDTVLGLWLRQKPVILSINDFLFVHAGLSPEMIERHLPLDTINRVVWRYLNNNEGEVDAEIRTFLLGSRGILWYRGLIAEEGRMDVIDESTLNSGLDFYNAKSVITGHTEVDTIKSFFKGKVIDVNIPMRDPNIRVQGLLIRKGKLWVVDDDRQRKKL
jgi:hypothetical protein